MPPCSATPRPRVGRRQVSDGSRRLPVFAWITGQDFNIGDSILRRPYVDALTEIGDVDIWVRGASDDFLTGLDLDNVVVSRSFVRWYLRALRSALAGRTCVAFNAGEVWVSWSRAVMMLFLTVLSLSTRLRGGFSVWLGASIRPTNSRVLRFVFRLAIRSTTLVWWREAASNSRGLPRKVGPDWAFETGRDALELETRRERRNLAFILRGDRTMPGQAWLAWVSRMIEATELAPVFVVQVQSDRSRAYELAALFSGEVADWAPDASHREQEEKVRAVFRTSAVAIGDRLHGLVLAATEGAVPLGWVDTSGGKIASHFQAAGFDYVGEYEGDKFGQAPGVSLAMIDELAGRLPDHLQGARTALHEVRAELLGLAASRRGSTPDPSKGPYP
jgi:polysaccharide pyruvyl transferase WcaK-like protein